jgi:hypothetical protein
MLLSVPEADCRMLLSISGTRKTSIDRQIGRVSSRASWRCIPARMPHPGSGLPRGEARRERRRAISSAGEQLLYTEKAGGSNPSSPTSRAPGRVRHADRDSRVTLGTINAGTFRRIRVVTMPEDGSSYPLRLTFAPDDGSVGPGAPGSPIY